jgi:hypothetical protein
MTLTIATPAITQKRDSINGSWVLDKKRGDWKMNNYLATMNVDPLAIQAHEKGELDQETIHTISVSQQGDVEIIKQSRVNNNVIVQLKLGEERVDYLPPGARPKKSLARSDHPGHLEIVSTLQTVNGTASVHDVKNLIQEEERSVMVQELSITNETTNSSSTTTRYFNPCETPAPEKDKI